jgi:hypothetical protein
MLIQRIIIKIKWIEFIVIFLSLSNLLKAFDFKIFDFQLKFYVSHDSETRTVLQQLNLDHFIGLIRFSKDKDFQPLKL